MKRTSRPPLQHRCSRCPALKWPVPAARNGTSLQLLALQKGEATGLLNPSPPSHPSNSFAPHGGGDQTCPVDQRVTLYCQRGPYCDLTAGAVQRRGEILVPPLTLQH